MPVVIASRSKSRGAGVVAFAALVIGIAFVSSASASGVDISDPYGVAHRHPSTLAFSTDGDLVGTHLSWKHWGEKTSKASGTFLFRTEPSKTVKRQGSIIASQRKSYAYGTYYGRVTFQIPNSPFGHMRVSTFWRQSQPGFSSKAIHGPSSGSSRASLTRAHNRITRFTLIASLSVQRTPRFYSSAWSGSTGAVRWQPLMVAPRPVAKAGQKATSATPAPSVWSPRIEPIVGEAGHICR